MNWFERLQKTFAYIEEHLLENLNSETIARIAFASEFHFQRMFFAITDMSLWEYIRKRRLSLAAAEVIQSNRKIIDIATRYGYENPESFTRAFKKVHGVSPTQARKQGETLTAFPPLSIQISIRGGEQMEYRLEKKEAFSIRGVSRIVSTKNDENFKVIPEFWNQVVQDGTYQKLMDSSENKISYGLCGGFDEQSGKFTYGICVDDFGQEEYQGFEVPATTWAIFTSIGKLPSAIQELTQRIFKEWIPATEFKQHATAPELEVYLPGDPTKDDYKCEVWIPVEESRK